MKKDIRLYGLLLSLACLAEGCSVSKFVPEGAYLLDNVKIESDNRDVKSSDLHPFIRQQPNARWFNSLKLPMYIYAASGRDSSKWVNRFWRKLGDAPVIYSSEAAEDSRREMQKAVQNMGYMGAQVDLRQQPKGNKMKLVFAVHTGKPYVVEHLRYDIPDLQVRGFLYADSANSRLREGMRFDVNRLESERQRLTQYLQNNGFYRFNKDFIAFQADTMLNTQKVDLTFRLLPYQQRKEDAPSAHRRYVLRGVNYLFDIDFDQLLERRLQGADTDSCKGLKFYYYRRPFLRPKSLANYNFLRPGAVYSSRDVQDTYTSLGRLGILKYSNIRFAEVQRGDSILLDAYVMLNKGRNKSLSVGLEGTNTAGDLGAAASVSLTHRNLFKGSETFMVKLRGAYEAITGLEGYSNSHYMEYGAEMGLTFPDFKFPFLSSEFRRRIKATSEVSLKYNWQIRPEFERTVAAVSWSYRWSQRAKSTHRLDLLDVNYVYMPYRSEAFEEYLAKMASINPMVLYSYSDLMIVRLGYTYTYNSAGNNAAFAAKRNSYSIRLNVEEAGNVLYAFSKLFNPHPRYGENYRLADTYFAQYVKGDIDFTRNFQIDHRNSLVFHAGLGIAYPYANSQTLPFEKLYFSGGANSVRGWGVRSLGPGGYAGGAAAMDYLMRTGELKLDLNLEYRTFLFWKLHGAAYIDAGNIWNVRDGSIEEGVFRFNRFYRQLAVSYGLGIRFDLDFLILRFDTGMKAVNPMGTGKARYPLVHPKFSRDFAFHFAVGYPF